MNFNTMNEFTEALKQLRKEMGLSQKGFATIIGMKPSAYNMIESGKNQPSYSLLSTITSVFNLDANRFFNKSTSGELFINNVFSDDTVNSNDDDIVNSKKHHFGNSFNEIEIIKELQQNARKIDRLYQHLVDIRLLLFQELRLRSGKLATDNEVAMLWELARPSNYIIDGQDYFGYKFESIDFEQKKVFLRKQVSCIELFTDTFFDLFSQLFKGLKIPLETELQKDFFKRRAEQTGNWTYKHVTDQSNNT